MRTRRNDTNNPLSLEVVTNEEALIFIEVAKEAGADTETAIEDLKLIDNMFSFQRLHFILGKTVRRTRSGHLRKDSDLASGFLNMIQGRIDHKTAKP